MENKKVLLSSFAALAIITANVYANETTQLDEVDVWETQVVSSSLNLGENSIEKKQADHLSDLLRDLPGVEVGGVHSINNRINMRGLQDEDLEITLDGAKIQNARMFHHIGNLLINPDILKKADIQVGTNSVVNGGLGGSIAFETKDGVDLLKDGQNFGGRISTTYNSNDSLSGSLAVYGKVTEKLNFLVYHNYINKNNFEYPSGEKSYGVDGEQSDTLLKASYDIDDYQTISLSYDKLTDEGDYLPRPNFSATANEALNGAKLTYPTEYTRETITLKHKLDLGEKLFLDTTAYSNENQLTRDESVGLRGYLDGTVTNKGINSKAQSNFEIAKIYNTLTYGVEYDEQESKVLINSATYGEDEKAKTLALYVENTIDFDNGLTITPGVRYTDYELDGVYGKYDDNKFTYGLAAEYAVNDNFTLHASGTTLYKGVPMLEVLNTERTAITARGDLKAETGSNKEIGLRYTNDNVLGADKFGFSIKYFKTDINNHIETWDGRTAVIYNNGNVDIEGVETNLKYIKGKLTTSLGYSKSHVSYSETSADSPYSQGDKLTLGLDYDVSKGLGLSWNSIFVAKNDDIGTLSGVDYKAGYSVHNASLKYIPSSFKDLTVVAGIDNIFDKQYINHTSSNGVARGTFLGDYEAGRNFKVTLAYKF